MDFVERTSEAYKIDGRLYPRLGNEQKKQAFFGKFRGSNNNSGEYIMNTKVKS